MLQLGSLSHLSKEKQNIVLAANPCLKKTKNGFCLPRDKIFNATLNFAESWLPRLGLASNEKTKKTKLTPKLFGGRVTNNIWYCPIVAKLRKKPTILRGGVVRSLRKLTDLNVRANQFFILTTKERVDRAKELFNGAEIMSFDVFKKTKKQALKAHFVVDEQFRVKGKLLEKICGVGATYRWLVNPYASTKCGSRELNAILRLLKLPTPVLSKTKSSTTQKWINDSKSTAFSLSVGKCCVCFEESNRLVDVCGKGHRCCFGCSRKMRRCMLCRSIKKHWL